MNSKEFVGVLTELFGMGERVAVHILYHDGHMGHSVTVKEVERGRGGATTARCPSR